jgi:hypothetical protein
MTRVVIYMDNINPLIVNLLRYIINLQNEQLWTNAERNPGKAVAYAAGNNPKTERNGGKADANDDGCSK